MSGLSPATVLFSSDGTELAVVPNTAVPTNTRGILVDGYDGTNARMMLVDSLGRQIIIGTGTAGAQAGGLLTIQGDPSGTPVPVSGTVTANAGTGTFTVGQTTASNLNALVAQGNAGSIAQSWFTLISDGTNGPVAVKPPSTPAVATDPALVVAISPNNTIVTSNASVSPVGSTPPADASYAGALVTTAVESGLTNGDMYPLSLTTTGLLRIDGSNVTQPVSGTVTANQGTAAALGSAWPVELTDGYGHLFGELNNPFYITGSGIAGTPATGVITVQGIAGGTAIPVSVSGSVTTTVDKSTTGTVTSVAGSTSNTTVLASNANRLGATLYNNTNKNMYVKMGTSASTSSFSTLLMKGDFWEVTSDYTGKIDAVWDSGVTGNVLVTELT